MKQISTAKGFWYKISCVFALLMMQAYAFAQDADPKVSVDGNDEGNWLGDNWLWVIGVIVLLLIIIFFMRGSTNKHTVVIKDNYGNLQRTTTEETQA